MVRNIYFIFLVVTLTSCKKFLDKAPDTLYAYPTTVPNLQAILDNPNVVNQKTPTYAECSADDYYLDVATYNGFDNTFRQVYIWELPTFSIQNDWLASYGPVYIANIGIGQIDNIPHGTADLPGWNNVKGSSYFIRAYYFLNLVWTFAKAYDPATADVDLGIVLRKTTDINAPSVRASVKESYQQIIDDAKQSLLYLPDLPAHPLRPSKAAAYGLLARTYLSMRDYDNAFLYADLCLNLKNDLMDYNADSDLVNPIDQVLSPFRVYNKETIFYTQNSDEFPHVTPQVAYIDSTLFLSYSSNDLRRSAFFNGSYPTVRFKGTYAQSGQVLFSGIATDEVWLIRAECFARKGNIAAALADLDTLLRKRWKAGSYVKATASTADKALEKILTERRKELLMRNLRWIDIKRLNKEKPQIAIKRMIGGQSYILPPNDNRFALPLPQTIIQITGMPQNPR